MHVQSNRTRTRVHLYCTHSISDLRRAHWLRGRASVSRLREPGFESCFGVKTLGKFFYSTDSGRYMYEQPSRINCWMLPREAEMVSERTGLTGKCKVLERP